MQVQITFTMGILASWNAYVLLACFTYGGHLQKVVECLEGDAVCPIHVHHNARRNRLQFRGEESQ